MKVDISVSRDSFGTHYGLNILAVTLYWNSGQILF